MMRPGDVFAALVGRLLLTQREVRMLLGLEEGDARIVPSQCDADRAASVAAALEAALHLVGDDDLVARWLREPLPRRGGARPLEEVVRVKGDRLIRFVLAPHPEELVRMIADGARNMCDPRRRNRQTGCWSDA